jgi:hypothetical protein
MQEIYGVERNIKALELKIKYDQHHLKELNKQLSELKERFEDRYAETIAKEVTVWEATFKLFLYTHSVVKVESNSIYVNGSYLGYEPSKHCKKLTIRDVITPDGPGILIEENGKSTTYYMRQRGWSTVSI